MLLPICKCEKERLLVSIITAVILVITAAMNALANDNAIQNIDAEIPNQEDLIEELGFIFAHGNGWKIEQSVLTISKDFAVTDNYFKVNSLPWYSSSSPSRYKQITKVVVADEYQPDDSFYRICSNLYLKTRVEKNAKRIGNSMFEGMEKLETVEFNRVETIACYAFLMQ